MKVCTTCNLGYADNVTACPQCGNQNLAYYPSQPQQGVVANAPKKPSSFAFGSFIKDFFKSPMKARTDAINRKDIGTSMIIMGIAFFMYLVYGLCLQGGLSIRYYFSFSGVLGILYPIVFFLIFVGMQFVDVFVYIIYSNSKRQQKVSPLMTTLIYCTTAKFVPSMVMLLASIFSLFSPIMGVMFVIVAIVMSSISNASAKLKYGIEPKTFVDSLILTVTGVVSTLTATGLASLLIYIYAKSSASSLGYGLFR